MPQNPVPLTGGHPSRLLFPVTLAIGQVTESWWDGNGEDLHIQTWPIKTSAQCSTPSCHCLPRSSEMTALLCGRPGSPPPHHLVESHLPTPRWDPRVCAGKCPTSGRFSVTGSGITVTHVKVISCLEYVLGDWARIVIGSVGDMRKLLGWVQSLHF